MSHLPAPLPHQATDTRYAHIDALRGIAVFGILLVNIWSFVWGFNSLRYGVLPPDATLYDLLSVAFVAFFAEQKFYPIFAFLFGASFVLITRAAKARLGRWSDAEQLYRRRLKWLLACGVVHGTLIWFGDILTVYAIAGFWVLAGLANARLRRVYKHLYVWLGIFSALLLTNFFLGTQLFSSDDLIAQSKGEVLAVEAARTVYSYGSYLRIAIQRISDYLSVTTQSVFILPHIAVLFLLGVIAVRRGWLTQPWRHTAFWRKVRLIGFVIGIPFNLVWATLIVSEAIDPLHPSPYSYVAYAWLPVGGVCLAAAYVACFMLAAQDVQGWLAKWLAPVGRMALTNYLLQSILCSVLLQGFGFGLGGSLSPAAWLLIAFAVMLLQLLASRWWLSRHAQGPLEAWSRRYINKSIAGKTTQN
ncbi:hypothetical protein D3C72_130470 [compost metagenome]